VKGGGNLFSWRTRRTRILDCSELVLYGHIREANYHVCSLGGEGMNSKAKLSLLVTALGFHRRLGRTNELRKPLRVLGDSWNADRAPGR